MLGDAGNSLHGAHFRNILSRVFSFELSSGTFSARYASGLETVVASLVEPVDVVVDGAGEAFVLLVDESREEGCVMAAIENYGRALSLS